MNVGQDDGNVEIVEDAEGQRIQSEFQRFLEEFRDDKNKLCYLEATRELLNPERNTLLVDFLHVQTHSGTLAYAIQMQFFRLYPYLCRALQIVTVDHCKEAIDKQRLHKKELYVSFENVATRHKVRELTADKIGTLLRIAGQVVRTHPVHPELCRGTFVCDECGTLTKNIEQQFRYTQPNHCSNPGCMNRTRFRLDVHKSSFVDFQKVRIQETQGELPRGSIPRSVEVILRGECVESVHPGDRCDFTGTLIVIPDVSQLSTPGLRAEASNRNRGKAVGGEADGLKGLKALGVRDLNYKLAFLACNISATNPKFGGKDYSHEDVDPAVLWESMTEEERNKMRGMSKDQNIMKNLINSLFPSIYGHVEVKQGVLLMLFGGVGKRTDEGTTLRGDINVCLVGDPSTAKSQVLKRVEEFAPRAVYTSGKASTAAGLTAAVVKDEESFEFVIEAGALMLADNGVCCIDEFDKMDPKDQVAIHEAMEQQTISITKAGVKATLNARTSILAAANPIAGRYDRSRSLRQNIQLSAPIMSRFDLFFVLVDECNEIVDYAIARRIIDTHRHLIEEVPESYVYSVADIQQYIMFARCFKPKISEAAAQTLVDEYKRLRLRDCSGASQSSWRITVRQLESLVRLSEALARLHCEKTVSVDHVRQASKLLNKSIVRVEQPDIALDEDDDDDLIAAAAADGPEPAAREGEEPMDDDDEPSKKSDAPAVDPSKMRLTFEQYKKLSDMIVLRIRSEEEKGQGKGDDDAGIHQSELVDWYLEMIEETVDSEVELRTQKTIVERVIRRLVAEDGVLIELNAEPVEGQPASDPILVVHPNYVMEDD